MIQLNKTNLFASMLLVSALFLSCSRADNPVDPINDDPLPEQPGDDQPGDDQSGDDQQGGDTAYLKCPDANHPHMIDLHLPSGTMWACCNVGAKAPEEYGGYYAWGETSEKDYYGLNTYKYYDSETKEYINIGIDRNIAGTSYDAATANWGAPWRMPTALLTKELFENTTSEWTTENGVAGLRFTGTNGGSIFLPAAGYRWNDYPIINAGVWGQYWQAEYWGVSTEMASYLDFNFDTHDVIWYTHKGRLHGLSVRPVR